MIVVIFFWKIYILQGGVATVWKTKTFGNLANFPQRAAAVLASHAQKIGQY